MFKAESTPTKGSDETAKSPLKKVHTKKPNANRPLTPKYTMSRNAIFKRAPRPSIKHVFESDQSSDEKDLKISQRNDNKEE